MAGPIAATQLVAAGPIAAAMAAAQLAAAIAAAPIAAVATPSAASFPVSTACPLGHWQGWPWGGQAI